MKPEIPYSSRISIRCLVVIRWWNARRNNIRRILHSLFHFARRNRENDERAEGWVDSSSTRRSSATVHEQRHHLRATFLPEAPLPSPFTLSSRNRRRDLLFLVRSGVLPPGTLFLYLLLLGRARFRNNAKGRTRIRRSGKNEEDGTREVRTAQTPAVRLAFTARREKDGKRSGLCAGKERQQDRWEARGGAGNADQKAMPKRRRNEATRKWLPNDTRPGTLASFQRNYQAHARIGRVLFSFLFVLFLAISLSLPCTSMSLSLFYSTALCMLFTVISLPRAFASRRRHTLDFVWSRH